MTHSLSFAVATSLLVLVMFFWQTRYRHIRFRLFIFYFLVTASHGVFDALTNSGLGIAFFAPFDNGRYFFSIQPIEVSPIGLKNFLSERSLVVLLSELYWLILPSLGLMLLLRLIRRKISTANENPDI